MVDAFLGILINRLKVIKVSFLLFLLLFICGRVTLLIHEFLGHALVVTILGHRVHQVTFQYFGDAWINYHYVGKFVESHETKILAAGVLSEILISLGLLVTSRKINSVFTRFLCTFLAAILIVHALHYSIMGLYFQYGDGRYFNHLLGEPFSKRLACFLLIPMAVFCFGISREYSLSITRLFQNKPLPYLAICSLIALGLHLVLTFSEQTLLSSDMHQHVFEPQHISEIRQELQEKEPLNLTQPQKQEIIKKHTPFDLKWVLYPMMFLSMLLGYLFAKAPPFHLSVSQLYIKTLCSFSFGLLVILWGINLLD